MPEPDVIVTTWTDSTGSHAVRTARLAGESESDWKLRHLAAVAEEMGS